MKIAIFSKKFTSILVAIVLVGSVGTAFGVNNLRFFAWSSDLNEVAQDVYERQIYQVTILIINVRQQLKQCYINKEDCSYLVSELARLRVREADLLRLQAKYSS